MAGLGSSGVSIAAGYFLVCELRLCGIDVVVRAQYQRVGSQVLQSRPDGEILLWQRPNKPHGMTGEQYGVFSISPRKSIVG